MSVSLGKNITYIRKIRIFAFFLEKKTAGSRNGFFTSGIINHGLSGTSGFLQLVIEVGQTAFTSARDSPVGGKASSYFLDIFNKVWKNGLYEELLALKQQYPSYQLWVTGHSLGGALAALAAGSAAKEGIYPSANIRLYTYGQPRTGDVAFAKAIEQLVSSVPRKSSRLCRLFQVPESYRVTHKQDIVPHVPPQGFFGYRHHKTEVRSLQQLPHSLAK